ncbi:hypothetical protein NFI00_000168 [Salmonella enterica]|nr:hypothetical protein [Salmonella enterica subsp. enterica serovar Minnesota]EJI5696465.1 hypothetical protein [Salmonella enterica]
MDQQMNLIPAIYSSGSFEALNPFDKVVDPTKYYTVEAVRTIPEMQAMKMNLYELVFKPIGVAEADYQTVLDRAIGMEAVIVSLTSRNAPPVYVISSYFKSFPMVDGVKYERMALIIDLGACPPALKDTLTQAQDDIRDYVENSIGITSQVRIGTIPTPGYVSKAQADMFENTRKNKITDSTNNVSRVRELESTVASLQEQIRELEEALIAKQ